MRLTLEFRLRVNYDSPGAVKNDSMVPILMENGPVVIRGANGERLSGDIKSLEDLLAHVERLNS